MPGLIEILGLKRLASMPPPPAEDELSPPPPADSAAPPAADERELNKAKRLTEAWAKSFAKNIADAEKAVNAQPIDALKATLTKALETLKTGRAEVDRMDPIAGEKRMRELDSAAQRFALDAEAKQRGGAEAKHYLAERGDKPFQALRALLDGQPADVKSFYQARFEQVKKWLDACRPILDSGDFDKLTDSVGRVFLQCEDLGRAVKAHAKAKPEYDQLRADTVEMIDRMGATGLLDADGQKELADLKTAVSAADALAPIKGFVAAKASLQAVVLKAKVLRDNNSAYRDYVAERAKVDRQVDPLKTHKQADKLKVELGRIKTQLDNAEQLSKKAAGGALKALTALRAVAADATALKALADKLDAAAAKLPALAKKLEAGGLPKDKLEETARMALKLLVEENATEEQAVKMAKDAAGYRGEGLDEQDAMMSSRVKKSLEDQGLKPDHAASIGRNVRAAGSSNADDAKALAAAMKDVLKKAIDSLNDAGVKSECCRGPVTDAMPDLAGVHPDGWPDTASWDEVPGVFYGGSRNTLVVGTIEKDGKRKVPDKDEGPNPHGATDLFGHEAGHAFDYAKGGTKHDHKDFKSARTDDIGSGKMLGSKAGGDDDYFMTVAEGGANANGPSETFAESFALYFKKNTTRWPKLAAFWAGNPWGI